jgi:excisionase family DNA binding protein
MSEKNISSASCQGPAADNQSDTSAPEGVRPNVSKPPERRRWGSACAPPPPPPPIYLRQPLPMYPVRPEGWVCRSCCRFWEWTYRPPTEPELDEPCVKCGEVLELQERAVEVQRLTQVAQVESAASMEPQPPEPGSGVACTVEEAGRRLGCKRTTVFQRLKAGRLVAAPKLGRQRMVLTASVDELLAAGGVGAARDARPAQSRP